MKTFFYTTMLLLLIFVSSCAEDDEPITIITASDFSFTIDEIQEEGASIGTISATTTEGTISYSITSSFPSGAIAIDSATGELTVLDSSAFDFETNSTITATVAITANGITETVDATIDINDVDTVITASDFSFTIDEIQEAGTFIGTISGTSTEGTISYSITSSSPSGAIAIDSATGELTVLDSYAFDFETNPAITATVAIIANGLTETVEVSINLNDVTGVRSYLLTYFSTGLYCC